MAGIHDVRQRNSTAAAIAEARQALGERLSTSDAVRAQHGKDLTWDPGAPPDAVAFVESTEEVQVLVRLALKHGVPLIPYGTGTSLEGHFTAPFGGICIDLSAMNQVLEVNAEDLDARVQAGVTRKQLNEHLKATGLFFPIDPGANASIGGMASTRASGTNAVRYGTMKDNVLALTVVTAGGREMRTAHRARKSSTGYDLTRLFVGAEGTLGIITSITLRLQGIPEMIAGGVCSFPTTADACNAVILTIQSGIPVARIELLDETQMRASNAYSGLSFPEQPTLFLEFHGSPETVALQSRQFAEIAAEYGGSEFRSTVNIEERNQLWKARHNAYWAQKSLMPGGAIISTDVCVPISRLADCVEAT